MTTGRTGLKDDADSLLALGRAFSYFYKEIKLLCTVLNITKSIAVMITRLGGGRIGYHNAALCKYQIINLKRKY